MAQNSAEQKKQERTAITPTRVDNFPEWYQEVIKAADMAENSPVRGCMIIKPYGYAIWENFQTYLNNLIRAEGVENAYFPLLIPLSYIAKEAEHIDGFAKECAVVTHHRLEAAPDGGLRPAGELPEPFIIRPTSETIIGEAMAKWVRSYRDLPLKLNQWANVMRWEMRPRMFLRSAEFLWQEGHCAHATEQEAQMEARRMLEVYQDAAENMMGVPVIPGEKTADERFPGAVDTLTIEAMMQDGKALQYATSHYLGTTFSKSANIVYQDKDGKQQFCHTTSWGMSTRTIGGLIMVHGDDDGLRLPPSVAPKQIIILPVIRDEQTQNEIFDYCDKLARELLQQNIRAHVDKRDLRTGDKMWDAIKKGVPLRVEIGQREMQDGQLTTTRRDIGRDSKTTIGYDEFIKTARAQLDAIQKDMFNAAKTRMESNIVDVQSLAALGDYYKNAPNAGFARMDISVLDDPSYEAIKKEFSLSSRCKPFADGGKKILIGRSY